MSDDDDELLADLTDELNRKDGEVLPEPEESENEDGAPYKKGQTVHIPMGSGADEGGIEIARIVECKRGYGGQWYANVKWLTGPEQGSTTRLGPHQFEGADLVSQLGDVFRTAEAEEEDE